MSKHVPQISLKSTHAGLGDQMLQYDLIYRIAQKISAEYIHRPMLEKRIFQGVGKFTGIDLYPTCFSGEIDRIPLSEKIIPLSDIFSDDGEITLPNDVLEGKCLGVIQFQYLRSLSKTRNLRKNLQEFSHFPFRHLYNLALQRRPHLSPKLSKRRVVIHIRLGDTATMSLDDGRRLTVDGMRILGTDPNTHVRPPIDLQRVADLTNEIASINSAEVILLSDGFDTATKNLRTYRRMVPDLTIEECDRLIRHLEEQLLPLDCVPAKNKRVGESDENTKFAIDTISNCDILIWSSGGFAKNIAQFFGGIRPNNVFHIDDAGKNPQMIIDQL